MAKLYITTTGIPIEVATGVDADVLITATSLALRVRHPDGLTQEWAAGVVPNTDKVQHILAPGDLRLVGDLAVQAVLGFPDGSRLDGETATLYVHNSFE